MKLPPFSEPAHETQSDTAQEHAIERAMIDLYDHYFACQAYQKRYPVPNAATLDFLFRHGVGQAGHILDFGCGNGRYALELLQGTQAKVTGYDISSAAIEAFKNLLDQTQFGQRAHLLTGSLDVLTGSEKYDFVLLLFGVLSHVGARLARMEVLRHLHTVMAPQSRMVLSVPSVWRRRPIELMAAAIKRLTGHAQGAQAEPGNIEFTRRLAGTSYTFFYHLYSVRRLHDELEACGFEVLSVDAESLLPEWLITQHRAIGRLDALVSRYLPASLGYGIRVVVRPL